MKSSLILRILIVTSLVFILHYDTCNASTLVKPSPRPRATRATEEDWSSVSSEPCKYEESPNHQCSSDCECSRQRFCTNYGFCHGRGGQTQFKARGRSQRENEREDYNMPEEDLF